METHFTGYNTTVTVSRYLLVFWKAHYCRGPMVMRTRIGLTRHSAITAVLRSYP